MSQAANPAPAQSAAATKLKYSPARPQAAPDTAPIRPNPSQVSSASSRAAPAPPSPAPPAPANTSPLKQPAQQPHRKVTQRQHAVGPLPQKAPSRLGPSPKISPALSPAAPRFGQFRFHHASFARQNSPKLNMQYCAFTSITHALYFHSPPRLQQFFSITVARVPGATQSRRDVRPFCTSAQSLAAKGGGFDFLFLPTSLTSLSFRGRSDEDRTRNLRFFAGVVAVRGCPILRCEGWGF